VMSLLFFLELEFLEFFVTRETPAAGDVTRETARYT